MGLQATLVRPYDPEAHRNEAAQPPEHGGRMERLTTRAGANGSPKAHAVSVTRPTVGGLAAMEQ